MGLPTIHICEACSQRDTCSNKLVCVYSFLDWEEYKRLFLPSSQIKRCDIILNNGSTVFFIELKAKDWFNEEKKTSASGNVIEDITSDLTKKIIYTYDEYNDSIITTQKEKNIFSVVFSKQMSVNWEGDEIPSSLRRTMLRTRVVPKFHKFDYNDHSFIYKDKRIFLDARECSHVDKLLDP